MDKPSEQLKPIPRFASEAEERAFWEVHDSTGYVDWRKAERARFLNLKPSARAISLWPSLLSKPT